LLKVYYLQAANSKVNDEGVFVPNCMFKHIIIVVAVVIWVLHEVTNY